MSVEGQWTVKLEAPFGQWGTISTTSVGTDDASEAHFPHRQNGSAYVLQDYCKIQERMHLGLPGILEAVVESEQVLHTLQWVVPGKALGRAWLRRLGSEATPTALSSPILPLVPNSYQCSSKKIFPTVTTSVFSLPTHISD